ncbi:MAG: xanthine dehydrogenase family protein subunit M [Chloroflexi bacterium]|nr:xanthine dehydrogenase family protein subunit M [Chloroflexota bacterium]
MRPFEYQAPATLEEAVALLQKWGERARPLAGGTDLIVQLRRGMRQADLLVDVKRIPELTAIRYDPTEGLILGAAVPCADVADHPAVRAYYPALVDGAGIIGGSAIRQRATVGGNLCNASPSGDAIPPLMVLEARAEIAGPKGRRSVPVSSFCLAPGRSALAADELLVSLRLPPPGPREGARYLRFTPRGEMDIAVVGVAAWVRWDESYTRISAARIALGAVASTPLLAQEAAEALIGREPDEAALAQAARLAQEAARPIDDVRGTFLQRLHLVAVLTRRALRDALQRAKGAQIDGE